MLFGDADPVLLETESRAEISGLLVEFAANANQFCASAAGLPKPVLRAAWPNTVGLPEQLMVIPGLCNSRPVQVRVWKSKILVTGVACVVPRIVAPLDPLMVTGPIGPGEAHVNPPS